MRHKPIILVIFPNNNDVNNDLDFSDDPADPAGDNEDFEGNAPDIEEISPQDNEVWTPYTNDESLSVFTRKSVNANKLIATGKKYLGVKYLFGAASYARTKKFDCSSFKMLHSSPKPKNGVQITNINKAYWKRTYLGAKRVIK
jgi:cell wall-associated NlpC family hydrolase